MPDIKAITMVRNDRFLQKWVEYYGSQLGRENLYVYFDGEDQEIPDFCHGVNTALVPKLQGNVAQNDRQRSRFVSACAAKLFSQGADMVIATDADEFLIVDPRLCLGLADFLSSLPSHKCYSGLGVDVLQHLATEKKIDFDKPLLSQRIRGWFHSRYTKPSVITQPLVWGGGFHRVKGQNFHIVKDLYLFHFGGVDLENLRDISSDPSRIEGGWTRHQLKRQRAIHEVSHVKAFPWDSLVDKVRMLQSFCRPIFALNKPTTYGKKFVAEIPERFRDII